MIAVASVLVAVLLFQVGGSRGIRDARRGMIQPQRTQHALRENGNSNAGRRFMRRMNVQNLHQRISQRSRDDSAPEEREKPFGLKEYLSDLLGGAAAQGQAEKEARAVAGPKPTDQTTRWPWWFVLPIQPGEFRPTTMKEVVAGKVWVFDQLQGAINILVNVRMTILRLEKGGLLVYAPIAPTEEAIAMIRDLEQKHGNVRHIVLPTQAVEHKIFLGPFARRFPNSEVWVSPGQWSWPVPLPLSFLGLGLGRRVHTLEGQKDGEGDFPDDDDVTAITLGPFSLNSGLSPSQFAETALYHHSTGSLLVTDTLVYVPQQPLEITTLDPFGLLFHARNVEGDPIVNTPAKILEGWIKTALLAVYIRPSCLDISDKEESFIWSGWEASFEALKERLIPTPFIRQLVLRRFEADIEEWVAKIGEMCPGINRVIPCHFEVAEGIDTKDAYLSALRDACGREGEETIHQERSSGSSSSSSNSSSSSSSSSITAGSSFGGGLTRRRDMQFLIDVDTKFEELGIVPPPQKNGS